MNPPIEARLSLHPEFTVGDTDPRLFGSFIEHLGRAVYTGIYEPDHPEADEQGFRKDVLALVRELQVPIVRYPGGNFVSGYNWEDGIGPRDQRPRRLDLAWASIEPNWVGTHEFADWTRKAGAEVMMAVNLGTRDLDAARNLVEYCNHPGGTYWSDLRAANGHREPFKVRTWCLGNEMDGPWQIGAKSADDYGKTAVAAARAMKWVDPSIELVVCGTSSSHMPSFLHWEETVLDHVYDEVDYLSLHQYFNKTIPGAKSEELYDTGTYVGLSTRMDEFLRSVIAACDFIQARRRSRKRIQLNFDEWNIWWHSAAQDRKAAQAQRWTIAPRLLEDIYTFEDVILFGAIMLSLIRHCDRVRIACVAQLVNVIAPIMTEPGGPAWRQTIFYPLLHGSLYGRGTVLQTKVHSPFYETNTLGEIPYVDSLAVLNADRTELTIFAINRSEIQRVQLSAGLEGFGGSPRVIEHLVMECEEKMARNTLETPERVVPRRGGLSEIRDGAWHAMLAPFSWNVIRIALS